MTQSYLKHISREGERWDLIAHQYYGDALLIDGLILANPHLPIFETFAAGLTVFVPVRKSLPPQSVELPPWKR